MADGRPRLLDFCCGAGGAGTGYDRAGFEVVGVDIDPQPRYPFDFIQGDALEVLRDLLDGKAIGPSREGRYYRLEDFAGFHASPPCQAFTQAQRLQGNNHPELVAPIRERLIAADVPWVIENVPGAPLLDPVTLCGAMFPPLRVYRHRLFETNFDLPQPPHVPHTVPQVKMGRKPLNGEWLQVVGNFSGVEQAREAMGTPWMAQHDMAESIPPSYTEWVGRFLITEVRRRAGRLFA